MNLSDDVSGDDSSSDDDGIKVTSGSDLWGMSKEEVEEYVRSGDSVKMDRLKLQESWNANGLEKNYQPANKVLGTTMLSLAKAGR